MSTLSTRDKILHSAMVMFGENPAARLSVRAVAARAGVSTGSLRYHFPTQRELQETVLSGIYDLVVPDDVIHDTSVPGKERLLDCLRQVLSSSGVGEEARAISARLYETFILPEPSEEVRSAYLAIEQGTQRRVEHWLTVLVKEGALAAGDTGRRARFLLTVLDGISIERALPARDSILVQETETLTMAVDCVFMS